jgi:hypothetical protein
MNWLRNKLSVLWLQINRWLPLEASWSASKEQWDQEPQDKLQQLAWKILTWALVFGLILLFLATCGGCAAALPVVPQILPCRAPEVSLQPTPEPQMQDMTTQELVVENELVRSALRSCNTDKADVLRYLKVRETQHN